MRDRQSSLSGRASKREGEADAFERAREKDRALSERKLSLLVRERESPPSLIAVSFSERGR